MTEEEKMKQLQQELDFLKTFVSSMNGSMGNYIIEDDNRMVPTYISDSIGRMIGVTKEEYLKACAHDAMDCIHPDDRKRSVKSILDAVNYNKATSISFRCKNKEGGYTWLNGSYSKSGEIDGKPMIRVVFTPTSTQFELQQDIIHNMPGGICLYQWNGIELVPLIISDQFAALYGAEKNDDQDKISAVDFEYVHVDDLEGYQAFIRDILEKPGKECNHTFRFWNIKENRYVWISVSTMVVRQNDGRCLVYASYSNVDHIKENEALLQARINMEQERLLGGDGLLMAYLVSNIEKEKVIEHKTFYDEAPIAGVGMSIQDATLLGSQSIADPDERRRFLDSHEREHLMGLYTSGITTADMEYRRKKPDGKVAWEKNVMNILREPESGDLYLYEYCYDINKEKILEETMYAAVKYDYERFGSINLKEDQISILESDEKTHDYDLIVKKYSELCHQYAEQYVYEEDRDMFLGNVLGEYLEKNLEKTGTFEFVHREYAADGTLCYKQDRHSYYDREKKICLLTRTDITETVKAEEEKQQRLQEALDKEKEAARIKSDFLSRMSHELRTPLNAISGYAELLRQNMEQGRGKLKENLDHLKSIQTASKYLLAIIGDILDTQKIESGKFVLVRERVNAADFMNNVVGMIRPEAQRKNINFTYDRLTNFSEYYYVDGVRLQQVLLNILHNAIKFTPEGGHVTMTAESVNPEESKTGLRFIISDTGIGMSKEFMEQHLYQAFSQENRGITSPYEGTGIGLSISKELVRLMEGDIVCESEKGKGTRFTVTIKADTLEEPKRRERRVRNTPSYDLGGKRILICEDNLMNQDMTKKILTRMNCQVEVADNGSIGVDIFGGSEAGYFDLILMDLRMPVMDGFEATRTIRAMDREDAKKIPILALSANAFEEDVRMTLESGMNEHMAKPMDARKLYTKIQEYCGKI